MLFRNFSVEPDDDPQILEQEDPTKPGGISCLYGKIST